MRLNVHLLRWNMHRWKVVVGRMVSHDTMRARQWALFIVGFLEPQSAFKDFFFFCLAAF